MDRSAQSRFLSLVLRHRPEAIGLRLDAQGWAAVDELLAALAAHGRSMTRAELEALVRDSDKQRFALRGDRIRASQGHSIAVDLGLVPREPPAVLYHGTIARVLPSIRREGLIKGSRTHVHLSADRETALRVGARRGEPVLLRISAAAMHAAGHAFFCSDNGVWLVDAVPPRFLTFP